MKFLTIILAVLILQSCTMGNFAIATLDEDLPKEPRAEYQETYLNTLKKEAQKSKLVDIEAYWVPFITGGCKLLTQNKDSYESHDNSFAGPLGVIYGNNEHAHYNKEGLLEKHESRLDIISLPVFIFPNSRFNNLMSFTETTKVVEGKKEKSQSQYYLFGMFGYSNDDEGDKSITFLFIPF